MGKIRSIQRDADCKKLKIIGGNKFMYDFSDYKTLKELLRDIYYRNMSINKAEQKQDEFDVILSALSEYSPRDQKYIKAKNKLLDNAKHFYKGREKIIERFKNKIFPIHYDDEDSRFEDNDESDIRDNNGLIDHENFNRLTNLKRRSINEDFFREYFKYQDPDSML